jgi:hypothetical protein
MRATGLALMILAGCQTYDFEPVTPLGISQSLKTVNIAARPLKPALFLVVDKSGSMDTMVSPQVTRMGALKAAMDMFLTQAGASAHLGMLPFPNTVDTDDNTLCTAGDLAHIAVPLDQGDEDDARLAGAAMTVKAAIDALKAGGGTPTALTMRSLGGYQPLLSTERDNFAVLLTDGVPNCNDANAAVASTCACTMSTTCAPPSPNTQCATTLPGPGGRTLNQCLDDQGSADEIARLKAKNIRTIVIGFGTDVGNACGGATMTKMATAGGFTRPCQTNADCNLGDTCNSGGVDPCGRPASTCGQSFFQAGNAAELGRVLQAIKDSVTCPPCLQVLSPGDHPDPSMLAVSVDGTHVDPGPDTWQYRDSATAPSIEFVGAMCAKLMMSTVKDPVHVEIRSAQPL